MTTKNTGKKIDEFNKGIKELSKLRRHIGDLVVKADNLYGVLDALKDDLAGTYDDMANSLDVANDLDCNKD